MPYKYVSEPFPIAHDKIDAFIKWCHSMGYTFRAPLEYNKKLKGTVGFSGEYNGNADPFLGLKEFVPASGVLIYKLYYSKHGYSGLSLLRAFSNDDFENCIQSDEYLNDFVGMNEALRKLLKNPPKSGTVYVSSSFKIDEDCEDVPNAKKVFKNLCAKHQLTVKKASIGCNDSYIRMHGKVSAKFDPSTNRDFAKMIYTGLGVPMLYLAKYAAGRLVSLTIERYKRFNGMVPTIILAEISPACGVLGLFEMNEALKGYE